MPTQPTPQLILVSKALVQKHLDDLLDAHSGPVQRLTQAVLRRFHDRHVGISPRLALELALAIVAQPRATSPWTEVSNRLHRELKPAEDPQNRSRRSSVGSSAHVIVFRANLAYTIQRLAFPLLAEACRRLGESWFFCEAGPATVVNLDRYLAYSDRLDQTLRDLCGDEQGLKAFWKDRALTLASHSLHVFNAPPTGKIAQIPTQDFVLMDRLKTHFDSHRHASKDVDNLLIPLQHQSSSRQKEGGVEGIQVTRRMEHLDLMLMSERLYPREIFFDRLLNTGFTALKRPPQKERKRDILLLAYAPPSLWQHPCTAFIKTCWCEAITRFGHYITRQGLNLCEFRWIEADRTGGMRALSYFPSELYSASGGAGQADQDQRHEVLLGQAWLPDFLDNYGHFQEVGFVESAAANRDLAWCEAASTAQSDQPFWLSNESEEDFHEDLSLKLRRFAHIHAMVLMPSQADLNQHLASELVLQLPYKLKLWEHPRAFFATTYLAPKLNAEGDWLYQSHEKSLVALGLAQPNELKHLAGNLVGQWLEQWKEELYA